MNPKLLLSLAPLLLRKKRSWLLVAILLVGYQLWGQGVSGLTEGIGLPSLTVSDWWKEPREILVDRVTDARDAQTDTVEEFKSALETFKSVTNFDGGELEEKYTKLNRAFERCEDAATNINSRIDKVTRATNNLLEEWREELEQYHDPNLRARAEAQFDDTRTRADALISAMRRAETRTQPVLGAFRDQVLYLKHNLNMQAITSLDENAAEIRGDIDTLVAEMEASIAEANTFIESLLKDSTG